MPISSLLATRRRMKILQMLSSLFLLRHLRKLLPPYRFHNKCKPDSDANVATFTSTPEVVDTPEDLSAERTIHLRKENDELPISQLPNELLFQIFCSSSLPPHAATYPALFKKHCITKRYIAQVCYRWREVALDCPDMWCNAIDLNAGKHWTTEVLKRTRNKPLTILIPPGTTEERCNLVLIDRAKNIRSLYAHIQDPLLVRKIVRILTSFEYLEELSLITNGDDMSRTFSGNWNWLSVNGESTFPNKVRRLYLTGPSFPLPLYSIPNLTCLYVHRTWGRKSAIQWLDIIKKYPQLQELSLHNCIISDGDGDAYMGIGIKEDCVSIPQVPILLPHLKELELKGKHSNCGAIFRGLSFPSSCVLRFDTIDVAPGPTFEALKNYMQQNQNDTSTTIIPPPTSYSITSNQSSIEPRLSLFIKISLCQLHLRVHEEQVVKLNINLWLKEEFRKYEEIVISNFEELLIAVYEMFKGVGGFHTWTLSISSNGEDPWIGVFKFLRPLLLLKEVRHLRLLEGLGIRTFLKFVFETGGDADMDMDMDTEKEKEKEKEIIKDSEQCVYPNLRLATFMDEINFGSDFETAASLKHFVLEHKSLEKVRLKGQSYSKGFSREEILDVLGC